MHTDGVNRHEGHDAGRDIADSSTPGDQFNPESPGYETTDVNVRGVAVFLAGLFGSLFVFFFLCYAMGRAVNNLWEKQDGPLNKWHLGANDVPPQNGRRDLTSNAQLQQEQLEAVRNSFPEPRLDTDDSANQVADLHAREDLMLEHYSRSDAGPQGADAEAVYRIPIERAMELIAQRGLPVNQEPAGAADQVAYAGPPRVPEPLTKGFARTAVELENIEAREQRMNYGGAERTELMQAEPQTK
ncbi:MAG TPA: hypothetical protein VHU44_14180 [Acidobacteriaceae bacterium]|jgi:hypothetical protein|nr:hypothetical protein [Acidobacteriaceae bacterium]